MKMPLHRVTLFALLLVTATGRVFADNAQAEKLLAQGRVDEANVALRQSLALQAGDTKAHILECRVYYAQDMADAAVRECEQAAAIDGSSSDAQLWLGKAYGLKASQANMLAAFSIAKKVHTAFERAVQLDGSNAAAMSALGQYYVEAPGIVGGGLDKAQALAPRLMAVSPAKGHRLLALIANKKSDAVTSEAEYKSAIAAGRSADAYMDLAQFYQEHGQADKAFAAIQSSIEANRVKDSSLVDAASLLTTMKRSPELAERVLREYLASGAKSDDAPAFKVHMQLGDLLAKRGDVTGARKEYGAAVALASGYAPARKALQGA
jgi:tetratricopeptide (TPR) repeat protein